MTRKDFELIARALAYCEAHCDSEDETGVVRWVAETVGLHLKAEHPRFDSGRFHAAALPITAREQATRVKEALS